MISTATTTTATLLVAGGAAFSLIAIVTLLVLLVQKEISGSLRTKPAQRLSGALNVALVPLLIAFIATAAIQIAEALR